jgi:aminoglycoside phosphotransferase
VLEPPPPFTEDEYRLVFADPSYWRPYILASLSASGLPGPIEISVPKPGTNPVFELQLPSGAVIFKLFTPFFGGREHLDNEVKSLRLLQGHPKTLAPKMLAEGYLFPGKEWPWPYLVMEKVAGTTLDGTWDGLSPSSQLQLADQIGGYMRALHDVPTAESGLNPQGLAELMVEQRAKLHQELAVLEAPPHLVASVDGFLDEHLPSDSTRVLLHGDLTAEHFVAEEGNLVSVIDYGDSKIGHRANDFIVLHVDLFGCRKDLLNTCLSAYGYTEWDACQVLAMTLTHQWGRYLIQDLPGWAEAESWPRLAQDLYALDTAEAANSARSG